MAPDPAPLPVLIHGLGACRSVWDRLRDVWLGPLRVTELLGHGARQWVDDYSLEALAADVADQLPAGSPVVVVGHSLGGAVAVALGSGRYGVDVVSVIGIGIKVRWTSDDVAAMTAVAAKGIRWSDHRSGAAERYIRQAGLSGLVGPGDPAVEAGITEVAGRWRPAQDPDTFAVEALAMDDLVEAAVAPVILAAGEHDPMSPREHLVRLVAEPRIAPGRGHNVHVEDPAWVAGLVGEVIGAGPGGESGQ